MSSFDLLGGKYKQGEQILPGALQTFRGQEVPSGRPVFVHRVSRADEPAQQLDLFQLLSSALVRSEAVRKMILDVRDEDGWWFVITDSAPQCLLLREWLQFELGQPAAAKAPVTPEEPSTPLQSPLAQVEPGEFTKMFQQVHKAGKSAEIAPLEKAPELPATPTLKEASKKESGEFTRFFRTGPPAGPGRRSDHPSNPSLNRSSDRPTRSGFVQRPNTPMPSLGQKGTDSGEFTNLFSRGNGASKKSGEADMFKPQPETPMADPAQPQQPGEYTRIFGKGNIPAAADARSTAAPPVAPLLDDPLVRTPIAPNPPEMKHVPSGPGEYTRVIRGNRPLGEPGANNPGEAGEIPGAAPAMPMAAIGMPPLPHAPPLPQLPPLPHAPPLPQPPPLPQMKAPAAPAKLEIPAAGAPNKKLLIFLAVLGFLALLMVGLVVLVALKK